jgi:hypothetical protein
MASNLTTDTATGAGAAPTCQTSLLETAGFEVVVGACVRLHPHDAGTSPHKGSDEPHRVLEVAEPQQRVW